MHASQAWLRAYRDDGFVVIEDLLDPARLARLRQAMDEITADPESLLPRLKAKMFFERDHVKNNPQWYAGVLAPEDCGNAIRQIADLGECGPVFRELLTYPPILEVLETLFESTEFSFINMTGRPKAARVGNGISNGHFHRDTPFADFSSADTITAILCLDDMSASNGATSVIRSSHLVSDEEAAQPCWRDVPAETLDASANVPVQCRAGAGLFFTDKLLHAAGHNRSPQPRRTILMEWAGPDALPITADRHPFQGLRPRSQLPAYQKQTRLTFAAP